MFKTMFNECECVPCAPRVKARTNLANAQIIGNVPVEATQRDYAIQLIGKIGEEHVQTLRKQFHMDNESPKTFLELKAIIEAGDYIVSDLAKSEEAKYYGIFYGVKFGQPADKEGYDVAKDVLKAAAQKALTGVTLKPIDALEGVIDDFEAWVYTPAA
jgi:hypothetical protein